jgi:hypothetical protein
VQAQNKHGTVHKSTNLHLDGAKFPPLAQFLLVFGAQMEIITISHH